MRRLACAGLLAVILPIGEDPAAAQSGPDDARSPAAVAPMSPLADPELPVPLMDGAPAIPIAPAMITRDAEGRATVRAVRVTSPLRIDGVLDEAHYTSVASLSDFIQVEPSY